MTVGDLLELLEGYDEDTKVRIATQPSWPLEHSLGHEGAYDDDAKVLYLAEGQQLGYVPGHVAEQLGWR